MSDNGPTPHWCNPGRIDLEALAAEHGTPFYLYDMDTLRARIQGVRGAFGGVPRVYYAVKTNPNLEILRSLDGDVDGLDISSGGELAQGVAAGHDPGAMSFAGPAKTTAELTASVEQGVGSISVESDRELEEIIRIASETGRRAGIVLRVNPKDMVREFGMKMGGKPIQFGVDEERLHEVARTVVANEAHLDFRGLHVYAGSQCFEPEALAGGVRNTLRIVEELEAAVPLKCASVNFGGGFGVSHSEERELDVAALGQILTAELRQFAGSPDGGRRLVFELGRYLMAEAGVYVVRVVDRKVSRGKSYALTDGGLHHHLAAGGMFGMGLRSNYLLRNLSNPGGEDQKCSLAGPLCNPTDQLGVNVTLPEPRPGDLIGVLKSGSYAYTASPLLFLGRHTPAEWVHDGGEVRLGRKPFNMQDFN